MDWEHSRMLQPRVVGAWLTILLRASLTPTHSRTLHPLVLVKKIGKTTY